MYTSSNAVVSASTQIDHPDTAPTAGEARGGSWDMRLPREMQGMRRGEGYLLHGGRVGGQVTCVVVFALPRPQYVIQLKPECPVSPIHAGRSSHFSA